MNIIKFECETITPMFLAGADGKTPEFRPPSIKGAMRFWWRAMNGHLSIKELREEEGKIFGTSDEKIGRSKFSIRVKPQELHSSKDKLPSHPVMVKTYSINILEYLAYGTYEYEKGRGNIFIRDYIKPNQKFSLSIFLSDTLENDIINIVKLLSTFGGLGSRSRNGFGSFKILSINDENDSFYFNFKKNDYSLKLPKYSALSQGMRLWKTDQQDKWDDALAKLGIIYRNARNMLESKYVYSKRQYIAAPIIVGKSQESMMDRHSKPYFMSVHLAGNNKYVGYILYLPSEYAYGEEKIDNTKETKNFIKVCEEFNDILSKNLKEVIL